MNHRSVKQWSVSLALALAGCGGRTGDSAESAPEIQILRDRERERVREHGLKGSEHSLYFRLGGDRAIARLVDDLMPRAASDPKVNFLREGTSREWQPTPENVAHLKKMLVLYLASASGGPVRYEGKDLKTAHAGMGITPAEFDAFAAHLKASLMKLNVPAKEQDELLAIIDGMRREIVE